MFIPDNNMFVTNFVVYSLILTQNLGNISFDESFIKPNTDALLGF